MSAGRGLRGAPVGVYTRTGSGACAAGRVRFSTYATSSCRPAKASSCCSALRRAPIVRLRALGGLVAASRSNRRLAWGSSGMLLRARGRAARARSQRKRGAHRARPARELEPVDAEQRDGEAVHAKGDAAGVRGGTGLVLQAPDHAELVAMVVEAHAGGGLRAGVVRDQQLELQ